MCWLMVWPFGKNSACTMPLTSKKAINITLILDLAIFAFFGLSDVGIFHWRHWRLVSRLYSMIHDSPPVITLSSKFGFELFILTVRRWSAFPFWRTSSTFSSVLLWQASRSWGHLPHPPFRPQNSCTTRKPELSKLCHPHAHSVVIWALLLEVF